MPIKVTCTQCSGVLHAPDDSSGKRGRCPTCGTVLTIIGEFVGPASTSSQFGAPPPAAPRTPATTPVTNPWGSLPGGPDDHQGVPPGSGGLPAPTQRPTYDLAKDPLPPRPAFPQVSEPIPSTRGSRVPPDPRKVSVQDPFSKPGKPNDEQAETNSRWAKAYRGLGWVRTGILFLVLGVLVYSAIPILQAFQVQLPNQTPGILKIDDFSQTHEIRLLGTTGAIALGLLCLTFGRIGVARAPAAAHARGVAAMASLATIASLAGFIAVAVITGLAMKDGGFIPKLTPDWNKLSPLPTLQEKWEAWAEGVFLTSRETTGQVQGFGVAAFFAFGLIAEIAFIATLGRIAASLRNPTAAGRVNRLIVLFSLCWLTKVFAFLAARVYYSTWFDANIWSQWAPLDDKVKLIGPPSVIALVALAIAILYWRMIGGVRTAIRENVDINS